MTHDFQKGSITVYIILKLFFSNTFRRCNLNVDVLSHEEVKILWVALCTELDTLSLFWMKDYVG